jgi:Asp-tRNA(Asn)/Glu-tRNA(Gln) amidotransferase C subunit
VWRGDEIDAGSVTPEQLLDLAAEQSGHCVKVPKVL